MKKYPIIVHVLSFLLLTSMSVPLKAESSLQAKMKSFSRAITDFRNSYKKCYQGNCSPEELKKLRTQVSIVVAAGGAIMMIIGLVVLKRSTGAKSLKREPLGFGRVSADLPVEGQDYGTKERRRREKEQQEEERKLIEMRKQQDKIEEDARKEQWEKEREKDLKEVPCLLDESVSLEKKAKQQAECREHAKELKEKLDAAGEREKRENIRRRQEEFKRKMEALREL